jgi:Caspase domain
MSIARKQGRRFAVVVGVSRYLNGYQSLRFAGSDALKVATVLQASGYQVQTLATDTEIGSVRRQAVLDAFTEVALQAKEDDTLLFYFSGHGSRHNGRDYLLLSDAAPMRFEETALNLESLGNILAHCKARQRLFVVDACRDPGLAQVASKGRLASGFSKGGLPRGFQENVARTAQRAPQKLPTRWAALFACSPDQVAKESDEERSGVFTTRLLAALSGGLGGTVTVEAAQRYIQSMMPSALRGIQQPDTLGDKSFPIAEATPNLIVEGGNGFVLDPFTLYVRFRLSGLIASSIHTEYIGGGSAPEGALNQEQFYGLTRIHTVPPYLRYGNTWHEYDSMTEVMRTQLGPAEWRYGFAVLHRERPDSWLVGSRWRITIYAKDKPTVPAMVRELTCTNNYTNGDSYPNTDIIDRAS